MHDSFDDEEERRPRRRPKDEAEENPRKRRPDNTRVPCPNCGGMSVRKGPWPWYLGTVGAIMCKAVICNECGHEYDEKKPKAHLPSRKRNLAIVINGIGFLGIVTVIVLLGLWINYTMNPH